jgi:hypothetical protein
VANIHAGATQLNSEANTELPINDLVENPPSLSSQQLQEPVIASEPAMATKRSDKDPTTSHIFQLITYYYLSYYSFDDHPSDYAEKGSTESARPIIGSTSDLQPDQASEIHAMAAEQIPDSPAEVPSQSQTDDITQIVSSDSKDEMVGTSSNQSQDSSGAEELPSTTAAPPEELQPAISQEPTVQVETGRSVRLNILRIR